MENVADTLNNAYQEFISAAAVVLEAKGMADNDINKTAAVNTALESLKQKWELFQGACDKANEFVDCAKKRIRSRRVVDAARGRSARRSEVAASAGDATINVLRLEQMNKSVQWLVKELQNAAGSSSSAVNAAHSQPSAPFDGAQ